MVHETKNAAVEPLADARRANLLTQHAFVSGITGGVVIVASGYLAHTTGAIKQGWPVLGRQLTTDNFATPLAVLFACALLMVAVDVAVRCSPTTPTSIASVPVTRWRRRQMISRRV